MKPRGVALPLTRQRMARALSPASDTGIRAEEVRRISFADLDRRRGTVYIMGKGAKERKLLPGQRGEPEHDNEPLILTDI